MPEPPETSRPRGIALTEQEKTLLGILGRVGAATAIELAVKTLLLPEEIEGPLKSLRDKRLVDVKKVPGRLGVDLIVLNERGLQLAKESEGGR